MGSRIEQSIEVGVPVRVAYGGGTAATPAPLPAARTAGPAIDGKNNAGVVTVHRLGDDRTKVMVQLDFEPEGVMQKVGSALGSDDRQVKGDLERFKEFVEKRGAETGAWRGEVKGGSTTGERSL